MITLKWTCNGTINNELKSDFKTKNTKRNNQWKEDCIKQMDRIGLPEKPFNKIYKISVEFRFQCYHLNHSSALANYSLMNLLKEAGIIEHYLVQNLKRIELRSKVDKNNPGFSVWIYIDETNPKNKGIDLRQLPIINKSKIRIDRRSHK
jgi:hypothetical protein